MEKETNEKRVAEVVIPIEGTEKSLIDSAAQVVNPSCRICFEESEDGNELLSFTCQCRGTIGSIHKGCLERWLTESAKTCCEVCGQEYNLEITPASVLNYFKGGLLETPEKVATIIIQFSFILFFLFLFLTLVFTVGHPGSDPKTTLYPWVLSGFLFGAFVWYGIRAGMLYRKQCEEWRSKNHQRVHIKELSEND